VSTEKVAAPDTRGTVPQATVTAMVTRGKPQRFFLREWRKFMGTKAIEIAEALEIERESYYRLERETWRINIEQVSIIAKTIGIRPSQLWFLPPTADARHNVSLDDLIENAPAHVQEMAIRAVRGIVGK
jgi:transcriptional regulator with XRE-family HTH domain